MMRIPKYPFQMAIAIAAGLFSLVLALEALKALRPVQETEQETT